MSTEEKPPPITGRLIDASWAMEAGRGRSPHVLTLRAQIGRAYASLCDQMPTLEAATPADVSLHPALNIVNGWLCGLDPDLTEVQQALDTALGVEVRLRVSLDHCGCQSLVWHLRNAALEISRGILQLIEAVALAVRGERDLARLERCVTQAREHAREAGRITARGLALPPARPASSALPWWVRMARWWVA